jgi:glycosyltransferase involved in cell wall biosynthesis
VLEAAACARAIVASGSVDGGGILMPDATGILVPRRSAGSLAAALRELIDDTELRESLGRSARAFAEEHFDARRNADRVMSLYADVIGT